MKLPLKRISVPALASLFAIGACQPSGPTQEIVPGEDAAASRVPPLGARKSDAGELSFSVRSLHATHIEVAVFIRATGVHEALRVPMVKDANGLWTARVSNAALAAASVTDVYYGYRVWGPNFTFDAAWTPGSLVGFHADVDADGNRFNPNKLLLDPYALEVSHDPINAEHRDGSVYGTGPEHRAEDSALVAPKGIVIAASTESIGEKPIRPFKDEIVYEVHLRGFTANDQSIPANERGTYAGAARKASYLKSIGVTAVEFLPLQETPNEQNDISEGTDGDNYWGYMTSNYFSPDRRYASRRAPGQPTVEFRQMAKAFHDQGIKVYVDVVYNHTAEGGVWDSTGERATLQSFRGIDNAAYYELAADRRFFYDNTGIGANFNTASPLVRDLIIDSLRYWRDGLGVDGFRFDLAPVLGNECTEGCFRFDKMNGKNALNRAVSELGARATDGGAGVDLIAEPWAIGTYQLGEFPSGWAEWNGAFRDTFRKAQNQLGIAPVTPGELASYLAGSSALFADDGRRPLHSVNFLVAHDGFTLRDLYSYNAKNNGQPWPLGPSDGGEDHNRSWDQGGDPSQQRQAARTGMFLLLVASGVPMIVGGDEMYRTQYGNNNAYNLDSNKNWLDWNAQTENAKFVDFSTRAMRFRGAHAALRRAAFFDGTDHNGNGLVDIQWLDASGNTATPAYMSNAGQRFLAFRIDGEESLDSARSLFVAYNSGADALTAHLPPAGPGKAWYRVSDTAAWMEPNGNFAEPGTEARLDSATYEMAGRSALLLIEK
jgi:glycogen operon protein